MKDLLSTDEAARLLLISPDTVRGLAQAGHLRAEKIGRFWLFKRNDVMRFEPRPVGNPNFVRKKRRYG